MQYYRYIVNHIFELPVVFLPCKWRIDPYKFLFMVPKDEISTKEFPSYIPVYVSKVILKHKFLTDDIWTLKGHKL